MENTTSAAPSPSAFFSSLTKLASSLLEDMKSGPYRTSKPPLLVSGNDIPQFDLRNNEKGNTWIDLATSDTIAPKGTLNDDGDIFKDDLNEPVHRSTKTSKPDSDKQETISRKECHASFPDVAKLGGDIKGLDNYQGSSEAEGKRSLDQDLNSGSKPPALRVSGFVVDPDPDHVDQVIDPFKDRQGLKSFSPDFVLIADSSEIKGVDQASEGAIMTSFRTQKNANFASGQMSVLKSARVGMLNRNHSMLSKLIGRFDPKLLELLNIFHSVAKIHQMEISLSKVGDNTFYTTQRYLGKFGLPKEEKPIPFQRIGERINALVSLKLVRRVEVSELTDSAREYVRDYKAPQYYSIPEYDHILLASIVHKENNKPDLQDNLEYYLSNLVSTDGYYLESAAYKSFAERNGKSIKTVQRLNCNVPANCVRVNLTKDLAARFGIEFKKGKIILPKAYIPEK